MTKSDATPADVGFALFASGAPFSCCVLRALQQADFVPRLIVIPEYPPAATPAAPLAAGSNETEFRRLARPYPVAFAPQSAQADCVGQLHQQAIDFILVACWPYLIEPGLIGSACKAALNLHPSLLPRDRGSDPIGAQLARNESHFGVTLHLLDEHFDHGDIIDQKRFEIAPRRRERAHLEQICAAQGVRLFIEAVGQFERGWKTRAQNGRAPETVETARQP